MQKIEKVYRDTDKICLCTGHVVEIFVQKCGKSNGIIGPGHHRPSWVESIGFGCDTCGQKYGEPVFIPTQPTDQIVFQLTLYKASLARKITLKDLAPTLVYVKGAALSITLDKYKIQGNALVPKEVHAKKIPPALKTLKAGTEIFVILFRNVDPHNHFSTVQLSIEKDSETFQIRHSCLT